MYDRLKPDQPRKMLYVVQEDWQDKFTHSVLDYTMSGEPKIVCRTTIEYVPMLAASYNLLLVCEQIKAGANSIRKPLLLPEKLLVNLDFALYRARGQIVEHVKQLRMKEIVVQGRLIQVLYNTDGLVEIVEKGDEISIRERLARSDINRIQSLILRKIREENRTNVRTQ